MIRVDEDQMKGFDRGATHQDDGVGDDGRNAVSDGRCVVVWTERVFVRSTSCVSVRVVARVARRRNPAPRKTVGRSGTRPSRQICCPTGASSFRRVRSASPRRLSRQKKTALPFGSNRGFVYRKNQHVPMMAAPLYDMMDMARSGFCGAPRAGRLCA